MLDKFTYDFVGIYQNTYLIRYRNLTFDTNYNGYFVKNTKKFMYAMISHKLSMHIVMKNKENRQ